MTYNEIEKKLIELLAEEFEIEEAKIFEDARLKEDMGIDSLEVVDVVVLIEENFGIKLQSSDFKQIKTLGDLCKFIHEHAE